MPPNEAAQGNGPPDLEEIMEDVQREIRRRLSGGGPAPARPVSGLTDGRDTDTLRRLADVYHVDLPARRPILGALVSGAKKVVRRLLAPTLARQVEYNMAVAGVLDSVREQYRALVRHHSTSLARQQIAEDTLAEQARVLRTIREELDALSRRAAHLGDVAHATGEDLGRHAGEVQEWQAKYAELLRPMRERISRAERKLRRIVHALQGDAGTVAAPAADVAELEPEFDYFGFEERFRGSEEDIAGRQQTYRDCFRGGGEVLDLACGRGEFLEVLRAAGISARGIDLDLDMVLACEEKGLAVTRADAFDYLRGVPDASLGGVFSAQFIEHLEPSRVIELVHLAHVKLNTGGALILETVNPRCLFVFAESFYMDFSHVRPIHPEALKFLYEETGFKDVAVQYSSPVDRGLRVPELPDAPASFNAAIARLNDLLYGPQDYAVVGRKAGSSVGQG